MSDQVTFSPSLTLPIDFQMASGESVPAQAYKLWACIPANDETGVVIDNVQTGDIVLIYDVSGIASFKETKMKTVKSGISIISAVVNSGVSIGTEIAAGVATGGVSTAASAATGISLAAPILQGWNSVIDEVQKAIPNDAVKHARRDAYGKDPGTGDCAKNEGGLIVCMPESKGAIYATSDFYLASDAKSEGRKVKYFSSETKKKNAFFPSNVKGGTLLGTATMPGAVHILAFDSKFTDNAGYYKVAIMVLRGTANKTKEQLIAELVAAGPNQG